MPLNAQELSLLTTLLGKIDHTQLRGDVWHALVKILPTVATELIILDNQDRVFLTYRSDNEFVGYHFPGSVLNNGETIPERLRKLIEGEVIVDAGLQITEPKPIGWLEIRKGDGSEEFKTRHPCCLIFLARLNGDFVSRKGSGFFPLNNLPSDTLGAHKAVLQKVQRFLIDGVALSGE